MLKRFIDIFLASVLLIITFPLIFLGSIIVFFELGRPIFFRQFRLGRNGIPFILYKFRTMNELKDEAGELLDDSSRITRAGQFLRRTSIDELPQLINVLRGDMSLVGPRPLLIEYLPLYSPEQMRRHEVRPGITGWAQVNGRNNLDWDEKFALDVWYVDNQSIRLDLRIFILTIFVVLFQSDINKKATVNVSKFKGSSNGRLPNA